MTYLMGEQHNTRPDVARAVAYIAPLWTSGLLILSIVIVLMTINNILNFEFSLFAIVILSLVAIGAFHMMVRDLRRDSALCVSSYRRLARVQSVMPASRRRYSSQQR